MDQERRTLQQVESTHHESHTPQLLVIDDSFLIHRLLKARLCHERLEVHSATSGREGVELATQLKPDVILLDLAMPDMDGFEVLTYLKSTADLHDIPVIFLSGSSDTSDRVRALEMGALDFITKPFEITELKARVRSVLRLSMMIKLLDKRAQVDGLTGLGNRTYFDNRLKQEVADALRHHRPLSLVMLDIDRFKPLNDTYGHPFGDCVLEEVGRLLEEGREGDIACRYGGEEFAIIMPDTAADQAITVAERLRIRIHELRWPQHTDLRIAASFGVADVAMCTPPTPERLLELADRALYLAKQHGRDRIVSGATVSDNPQTLKMTG